MTDYTVIRSHRRTMALEVTREGAALVRAPYAASDAAIARFAAQHQAWLESHMARRQAYLAAHPVPSPQQVEAWRQQAKAVLPQRVGLKIFRYKVTASGASELDFNRCGNSAATESKKDELSR